MPRFWDCATAGCSRAAAVDDGICERCRSLYCAAHVKSSLHTCEVSFKGSEQKIKLKMCQCKASRRDEWLAAQSAELNALGEKLDREALLRRATAFSGGKPCHLDQEDPIGRQRMGGMHVHIQLFFEDGTIWLARILRETFTSFDDQLSNDILLSECATLRWLEPIDVPTPRLYGYGLRSDSKNEVGVAYMLIDKLPGKPFDSFQASEEQVSDVLGQWARVLATLSAHPVGQAGSLRFSNSENGKLVVGPIAGDRTGTLPCIGPFKNAKDLYSSWASAYLDLIADGQLFSSFAVDAYLMFSFLLKQLKDGTWLDRWDEFNYGPFLIKHADDKRDHVLVDVEFRITGIIDWSFARFVPAYEAFGPSLISADNDSLFSGRIGLSSNDWILGQELKRCNQSFDFFQSDEMRRLLLGLGMGRGFTRDETVSAFQAIVTTFQGEALEWEQWRTDFLREMRNDTRIVALQRDQSHTLQGWVARFATCTTSQCSRPSLRGRSCASCEHHLCAIHYLPQYHHCPSPNIVDGATWEKGVEDEVESLLARVNVEQLLRAAATLRGGKDCKFVQGKYLGRGAIMGCANYHAWLLFDDGVEWLVRIPRTTIFSDIPQDLIEYLVRSEYATLKWLEGLNIPTPKAHGFGVASDPDNLVGLSYILEDAMSGQPFYAHNATAEQQSKVHGQYANFLIEIREHGVDKACSLLPHGQGPVASNRFLKLGQYGPYQDPFDYSKFIAESHLALIADGQLYPEYPKEAFLFYRLLRNRAAPLLAASSETIRGFFLKHVDDKGDHLLVDQDYNITAIIDWQFARFVPACEAFGPSLFTADLGKLSGGVAGLSADDTSLARELRRAGKDDLAEMAGGSELVRRFQFGLASGLKRDEVLGMIEAVISILDGDAKKPKDGIEAWLEEEWTRSAGELWHHEVERLVRDMECASIEGA